MRKGEYGSFIVSALRGAIRDRLNAHAAEIAFFSLLSLVPTTITLGGALHLLGHVGGPDLAARGQQGATESIRFLIGPKLADSVINPFVQTQLTQPQGLAITGLLCDRRVDRYRRLDVRLSARRPHRGGSQRGTPEASHPEFTGARSGGGLRRVRSACSQRSGRPGAPPSRRHN